ncbi:MAG: PAS domain S-box protein [Planctomycetota bacterium]
MSKARTQPSFAEQQKIKPYSGAAATKQSLVWQQTLRTSRSALSADAAVCWQPLSTGPRLLATDGISTEGLRALTAVVPPHPHPHPHKGANASPECASPLSIDGLAFGSWLVVRLSADRDPDSLLAVLWREPRQATAARCEILEAIAELATMAGNRTSELNQSEQARSELWLILDEVPAFIFYKDGDNTILDLNRAAADSIGKNPEEIIGRKTEELFPVQHAATQLAADRLVLSTGKPMIGVEEDLPTASGEIRRVQTSKFPLANSAGGFDRVLVIATDITDITSAHGQIENLRRALDEHTLLSETDRSGTITDANTGFCELSGYSREELIGQNHRIINSGIHPKQFWVDVWRQITSGVAWRGEVCNRAKDGSLYWVDSTIIPRSDARGRIHSYISLRLDITEKKRVEAALAEASQDLQTKNDELERFVYTASHDLKSPVVTILGYASHIDRSIKTQDYSELADFIGRIRRAAERMREHIDGLLKLSRVGRTEEAPRPVDIASVVGAVLDDHCATINEREIYVEQDLQVPELFCDPARLHQVLDNLISNALRYGISVSHPRVRIATKRLDDGACELVVEDNGPGIDPHYRMRVFELFQRLDAGTEGNGVGLAIVSRIASYYGGSASVDETPGGGASFRIIFRHQSGGSEQAQGNAA